MKTDSLYITILFLKCNLLVATILTIEMSLKCFFRNLIKFYRFLLRTYRITEVGKVVHQPPNNDIHYLQTVVAHSPALSDIQYLAPLVNSTAMNFAFYVFPDDLNQVNVEAT